MSLIRCPCNLKIAQPRFFFACHSQFFFDYSRLVIHCFHVCQELYAADDPLSVKYSITPVGINSGKQARIRGSSKTVKIEDSMTTIPETAARSVEIKESESEVLSDHVYENSHDAFPSGASSELSSVPEETEVDEPKNAVIREETVEPLTGETPQLENSEELIMWHGSTAAKTVGCRGWNRSDGEWARRPETSSRRRDDALVRCADDPKFRTRLCNHWDESLGTFCPMRKKGKCIFAHGPVELRVKEAKRRRWGKLVDKNGDNSNPKHSGGEDTYGAARAIESERKQEGKWKTNKPSGPKGKKAPSSKKKSKSMPPALSVAVLSLLGLSWLTSVAALRPPSIQVCQNKDCCKRWRHHTPLPDVLSDLLGSTVSIETTSCLSQCGKGPNLCVQNQKGEEVQLHEIDSPTVAVAVLQDTLQQKIPSKLLAAVNVLEKAYSGKDIDSFIATENHWLHSIVANNCSLSVVWC